MQQKKVNPHHFNMDLNSSLINLSFATQRKIQISQTQVLTQQKRKMRLLSLLIGSIYNKKITSAFHNIKYKPIRTIYLKKRLVQVFLALIRKSQFNHKYQAFLKLRKNHIKQKNQQIKQTNAVLQRAKLSTIKILGLFVKNKQKTNIKLSFNKISTYAKYSHSIKCQKYRKGFRIWIKVKNQVIERYFYKLRISRYLIQRRLKIQSIFKVLRQYRNRSLKSGIQKLRRNLYRQRQNQIKQQILQIDSKITNNQDQQLKQLKQKQQQLQKNLSQVKKQKQQISQAYQVQVKQAETKNIQLQSKIKQLKQDNQKIIDKIKQANQKLKQQFTMDEVFQMFYNNLLFYISKNKNSTLIKSQMLDALTKPLLPVDIPLDKLKQQNQVLKNLINQYVIIFGKKSIQGKQLQIPYEYLVKQNQTMYKMLVTLLPRLQYNKKDVTQLRQTLQSVQSVIKQFKFN